jgi:transposase
MGRRGSNPKAFELREGDRERLEALVDGPTTENRLAMRARTILLAADGVQPADIAERISMTRAFVGKWKDRYRKLGFAGLEDGERTGRPRTVTDELVAEVIKTTLETQPKGATHWSTRDLATKVGVSPSSVGRIWRAFSIKPHRSETFQISTDPEFVEKVHDVVGLYLNPPTNAAVFCVDEKTQVQALNRTQPILPTRPGMVERRTPEYRRHGTTDLFAALDVLSSRVIAKCYQRHSSDDFIDFLRMIDASVEDGREIHVILDNLSAHKSVKVKAFLARHPRIHLHFIPTHSSWLNLVESWFSVLTTKQLQRGAHTSVPQLQRAIYDFVEAHNDEPRPFRWTKTAEQILERTARYCGSVLAAHADGTNDPRTSGTGD